MVPRRRKGTAAGLSLELLGGIVRVVGDDAPFLRQLASCFEGSRPRHLPAEAALRIEVTGSRRPSRGGFRISCEPAGALEGVCPSVVHGPMPLARALVQWSVSRTEAHYVFHAGAVARQGRGVLLPGASRSGKSTLSAGLVRRGFDLLSDEVGAIALETGRLVEFPRSLWLRRDVLPLLGLPASAGSGGWDGESRVLGAADIGRARGVPDAEPSLILVPSYEEGVKTRLERLPAGAALIALMEVSCSQTKHKAAGLDFVIDLLRRVPCHRLQFSKLGEALDAVEAALEHDGSAAVAPLSGAWRPSGVDAGEDGRGTDVDDVSLPLVRDDLLFRRVDDDFVVYDPVADRTVLLNVSGAVVFDLCDGTRTRAAIAEELAAAFEVDSELVAPDVERVLGELRGLGLLSSADRNGVIRPLDSGSASCPGR
jgi:hypothetical protein